MKGIHGYDSIPIHSCLCRGQTIQRPRADRCPSHPWADSLHRYPFCAPFPGIEHLSSEGVPNRENGFERRVLRLALLAVTNDLASRLHQAIILSSEQHATDGHCTTLRRTSKLFLLFLQNIFNASGAEKNPEPAESRRLFGKQPRALRGIMIDIHVFRMGFP